MIDAVDATLAAWLARCCPDGTQIRFAAPAGAPDSTPANAAEVRVFLAEIRRDVQVQASDTVTIRNDDGLVTGRQQPVQWYRYGYQLTAHASTTEVEHRILGAILVAAAAEPLMPEQCRTGALADTELPVLIRVGSPVSERSGDAAQAATILDLVLLAPLVPAPPFEVAPMVTKVAVGASKRGADNPSSEPAAKTKSRSRRGTKATTTERPSFRTTHTLTEYPVRPSPTPARRKAGSK